MGTFGKVWGNTSPLLVTPMIELHRINIEPNAFCSMHKHQFKYNMFYVISGNLEIHVEKSEYSLTDVTKLGPGEFTTVKPNELHMFKTRDDPVLALEIYYLETIGEDIVRSTVGGIVENAYKPSPTDTYNIPASLHLNLVADEDGV
jgi:mannose-6-phosphate isomerase-like protein (cupin superfamily)